ncbi:MAG: hypothetical protein BWY93_01948 [Euryarchaeota archaeon ADurb.BinA087]|nr:MAG: hypothetical protein BWY93_01948 [Euryarchaeota archaeon ADurb.BinA087]
MYTKVKLHHVTFREYPLLICRSRIVCGIFVKREIERECQPASLFFNHLLDGLDCFKDPVSNLYQ